MLHKTLLLSLCFVSPLLAQRGDRPGEVQAPPPEHLEIPPAPALSADEALRTFKLPPGFRIEVVAADPLVQDPIAMAIGADGRIWVVEMRGYMPDVDGTGEGEPVGQIAVLEDTDGDGRMDKRTIFLDGLVMPRALSLVDDGLLVAEPTRLWYCRDTNGDGVADEKIEIADDYGNTTNPEHNANGLMWALDNWIYSANYTARFRYEGGGKFLRETTNTRGQWGITQDDIGRLYFNSNSDPLRADLVPAAYLRRNPHLVSPGGTNHQLVSSSNLPVWPSRVTPGINRGYRMLRPDGTLPTVTAACAPVVYRGTTFPREYYGNVFFCEPAGNLVKRVLVDERDNVLTGRNAYEDTEFLTSTDERFRPVNVYNGPDGGLYIVDMYRGIIQHRIYVTSYLRQQIEERGLEQPIGLGRIYRVVPDGVTTPQRQPNLHTASVETLVAHLSDPEAWWRETAQRLLVERRDGSAVPALRQHVTTTASALGRLHALWTLEGLAGLDQPTVLSALADPDSRVRSAGIRFAEKWLASEEESEVTARVLALAGTAALTSDVRLQLALSLSVGRSFALETALRDFVLFSPSQPLLADAVVSGLAGRELAFVEALLAVERSGAGAAASVVTTAIAATLRSGDAARVERALAYVDPSSVAPTWARDAVLAGIERYLPRAPDGRSVMGRVPAEPKPLLALAQLTETAEGQRAASILNRLRWPGKPGDPTRRVAELTPEQKVLFDAGREHYANICAACHQPNGQGLPGLAPALVNSRWVLGHEQILARVVLNGKEQVGAIMPPQRVFDDETMAAVMTYIRRSWGHDASPISPATVAEVRAATATRDEPWNDAELEELVDDFPLPATDEGEGRRRRRSND